MSRKALDSMPSVADITLINIINFMGKEMSGVQLFACACPVLKQTF